MKKIDVNCLVGNWPFRKIRKITFNDLKSIHEVNNMEYGYVSSLNSIFYNDPFEGDQDLHEIIKGTPYKHVLTVNPELTWFIDNIEEGIKLFDIKGVRIYPGYHGYTLDNQPVERLCRILAEKKLPLFITIRMEDERLNYLFQPRGIDKAELSHFLESHPENTVILLSIRYGEIMNILGIKEILKRLKGLKSSFNLLKFYINNYWDVKCIDCA